MGRGDNTQSDYTAATPRRAPGESFPVLEIASGKNSSALRWAERYHRPQKREADTPYLLHLVTVSTILASADGDRNLVCAGLLHDILEDTDVTAKMLRKEFGQEVTELVGAVTKDRQFKGMPLEQQADGVVAKLDQVGVKAYALKAADLLANVTDLVHGAEEYGVEHWEEVFGADRWRRKIAHYQHLAQLLVQRLQENGHYTDLAEALQIRIEELSALVSKFSTPASS